MPVQRQSRPAAHSGSIEREAVTIFMEDYRGAHDGEPEHLLAEVFIPLLNSTTHDGYWANAQELVDELQAGPSRIDGTYPRSNALPVPPIRRGWYCVMAWLAQHLSQALQRSSAVEANTNTVFCA